MVFLGITDKRSIVLSTELTEEMFNKRDKIGTWFCDTKGYYVSEDDFEDIDDEDSWHNYDGECQACDMYGPVDDMLLCDECAGKLERDLIRQRNWEHCVSAFVLPDKEREKLRKNVVKMYGESLELIAPSGITGNKRSSRRRKKRDI